MPGESQHTEWKASWQEDHLRWVCGFANAEGGRLEIGRDDRGHVVGLPDAERLLQELPNKIRDLLGILVAVNLRETDGKAWLEIVVDAYPNPISYRGHYYIRSGSTLQELRGAALDRFLLGKQGRTWDGLPVPGLAVKDLSADAIARFRQLAERSGRIDLAALRDTDAGLLDKLRLTDGTFLKRAAVLLFHPDPVTVAAGAFVKIGYFDATGELLYHDEVQGDLFGQVERTLDLLLTKYLKAAIHYEGVQRIERFPVPRAALREALLNALVHRDYAVGAPVQVRVQDDRLKLWNPAVLPEGWTLAKLLGEHASQPFNPTLANAFFRAGEIEAWGRGIHRIFAACREARTPKPELRYETNDLWMEFPFAPEHVASGAARTTPIATPIPPQSRIVELIRANPSISQSILAKEVGLSVDGVKYALSRLKEAGVLRRVGPSRGGTWKIVREIAPATEVNREAMQGRQGGRDSNPRFESSAFNFRGNDTDPVTDLNTDPVGRLARQLARGPLSPSELQKRLGLKHRPTFRANYLHPALKHGVIEPTLPDKPRSRLQRYRLTPAGQRLLQQTPNP